MVATFNLLDLPSSLLAIIIYALIGAIILLVFFRLIFGWRKDRPDRKTGPRPQPTFDATGWTLLVDGSNFAHRDIYNRPHEVRFVHLLEVLSVLEQRFEHAEFKVFCDANLRHKLNKEDRRKFLARVKRRKPRFFETHGESADDIMLKYARNHKKCIVVSNDNFSKDDEPQRRVGTPLLKVNVTSSGVRLPANADLFQHPDQPFKKSLIPLHRLFGA